MLGCCCCCRCEPCLRTCSWRTYVSYVRQGKSGPNLAFAEQLNHCFQISKPSITLGNLNYALRIPNPAFRNLNHTFKISESSLFPLSEASLSRTSLSKKGNVMLCLLLFQEICRRWAAPSRQQHVSQRRHHHHWKNHALTIHQQPDDILVLVGP